MSISDPISDMITKIRNASRAGHEKVEIPGSKLKVEIVKIFKNEGFIKNFKLADDGKQGVIKIFLKYAGDQSKTPVINDIQRVSKPGRRQYVGKDSLPRIFNGMGTCVVSTSHGVLTDRKAREQGVGGEVLCYIW